MLHYIKDAMLLNKLRFSLRCRCGWKRCFCDIVKAGKGAHPVQGAGECEHFLHIRIMTASELPTRIG